MGISILIAFLRGGIDDLWIGERRFNETYEQNCIQIHNITKDVVYIMKAFLKFHHNLLFTNASA